MPLRRRRKRRAEREVFPADFQQEGGRRRVIKRREGVQ
jgi:hypothetical protein